MRNQVKWIVQIIIMLFCFGELLNTDAYYFPYLFVLVIAIGCTFINAMHIRNGLIERKLSRNYKIFIMIFAIIFTSMIVLANYSLWLYANVPDFIGNFWEKSYRIFLLIIIAGGCMVAFSNILYCIASNLVRLQWSYEEVKLKSWQIFLLSFFVIVLIDTFVLVSCKYPGNLSVDSISQMKQIFSNSYSNHHPFFHTMVIRLFINMGLTLFGDINAAVCLYSIFQIVFMATCFSLTIMTLYQMRVPLKIVVLIFLFYTLMPYHIMYSFTMWKDVIYGGFVLLFTLFSFRCISNIGNKIINDLFLALSCIGTCIFRSNGFFAFVLTTVFFIIIWKFREKTILFIMLTAILVSFIMKHGILSDLGVSQPDTIESLSIPAQQIARVIVENNDFTDEERELLDQIIDVSAVPENYKSFISNPIKNLVRDKGNQQFLEENKIAYLKMYLSIGARNPIVYLKAWIDETKGYWNAGYSYWIWGNDVGENDLGINRVVHMEKVNNIFDGYLWIFSEIAALQIFLCIGFWIWIDIIMLFVALIRKDKVGVFLTLPLIMIVLSLLVATPVYSEFRYVYSVFCTLPLICVIVLRPETSSFSIKETGDEVNRTRCLFSQSINLRHCVIPEQLYTESKRRKS